MSSRLQVYETDQVRVTFDPATCIHSGVCLATLPAVFDISRKRWIDPKAADPEAVLAAVAECPSGALRAALVTSVHQAIGAQPRPATLEATTATGLMITVRRNGSLLVEGPFRVVDSEGHVLREGDKCALCRCGHSRNKPFCDNSHAAIEWRDDAP
jgi:uncharacterized Fe-S cluster protein YjdI